MKWNRFNIESGNRFADEGLDVELAEIAQVGSQHTTVSRPSRA